MSEYLKHRLHEIYEENRGQIERDLLVAQLSNEARKEERERYLAEQEKVKLDEKMKSLALARAGYVYFIRVGNRVKIGFSSNVKSRFENLQIGNPEQTEIVCIVPGLEDTELFFHKMFAESRIRGEWFELSAPILSFIENAPRVEIAKKRKPVVDVTQGVRL